MFRLPSLERRPLIVGALLGALFVFALWVIPEIVLRLVTHYPLLSGDEYISYFRSDFLASLILGAAAAQAWVLARQGRPRSARLLCLIAGLAVNFSYVGIAVWHGIQAQNSGTTVFMSYTAADGSQQTYASPPMWAHNILMLLFSKSLPFMLSLLMLVAGIVWTARGAERGKFEVQPEG